MQKGIKHGEPWSEWIRKYNKWLVKWNPPNSRYLKEERVRQMKLFSLFKGRMPLKTKQKGVFETAPYLIRVFSDKYTLGIGIGLVARPTKKEFKERPELVKLSKRGEGDDWEELSHHRGFGYMTLFFVNPVNSRKFVAIIPTIHLREQRKELRAGLLAKYDKTNKWHDALLTMIEGKLSKYKIPIFIASPNNKFLANIGPGMRKRFYEDFPNRRNYKKHRELVYQVGSTFRSEGQTDSINVWAKR